MYTAYSVQVDCIPNPNRSFLICISINRSNALESGNGGAVSLLSGSSATIFTGSLFSDNFAVNGGAISGDFATATLHSSTMHFNEARGDVSIPSVINVENEVSLVHAALLHPVHSHTFLSCFRRAEVFTCKEVNHTS